MSVRNTESALIEVIKNIRERSAYTKDFSTLRTKTDIPVFVYGTLKAGRGNNYLLKGSKYLGVGETCTYNWEMFTTGGFPVIFQHDTKHFDGDKSKLGRVIGEVYAVDMDTLCRLDHLEANGVMYERKEKHIYLKDQVITSKTDTEERKVNGPAMKCWTYIGVDGYWQGNDLPHIDPVSNGNFPILRF